MKTINREHFEAWLFSQPDNREFRYVEGSHDDKTGCVLCNFIRETTAIKRFTVGGFMEGVSIFSEPQYRHIAFESWTSSFLRETHSSSPLDGNGTITTGKIAKDTYTKLFPETEVSDVILKAPKVKVQ